jgi:hypothetical protein
MVDEIAFVSYPNPGVLLQLCLGRDRASDKKFSKFGLKKAQKFVPVIASLLTRQWSELDTSGSFDESKTTERISDLAK